MACVEGLPRPIVAVCDGRSDRGAFVCTSIAADADTVRLPDTPAARDSLRQSGIRVAIVGLEGPRATDAGLEAIRALVARGLVVISHGSHTSEWTVGNRCRALLAGACCILDSEDPSFPAALRERVAQTVTLLWRREASETDAAGLASRLGIVARSRAMLGAVRTAARVAELSDLPVLITGETGTGKQLVAEAIHQLDPKRRHGAMVALNCGAISPALAESELFGHRRGAFTGADRDRKGIVRAAHGGVLFLDEIGELELALQTRLLRVLQEGRVLGLGEDQEVPVSVRVIAATNRDLADMVRAGTFRADLYHRLNVLSVHLPPLRERRSDVAPLIDHFLERNRPLRGQVAANRDFVEALAAYDLPGNVRQLENLVRRALVNKEFEGPLDLGDLPPEIWVRVSQPTRDPSEGHAPAGPPDLSAYAQYLLTANDWSLSRSLESCERGLIEAALRAAKGNHSQTARLLGITPRCVYNKLRRHRLHA